MRTARDAETQNDLPPARRPQQARVRLHLKPGVVVVFDLRSQGEFHRIVGQGNFILHEAAVNFIRLVMRREIERRDELAESAGADSRSQAPDEILLFGKRQVMDEIYVKGVARLAELGFKVVGVVVVGLHWMSDPPLSVRFQRPRRFPPENCPVP